MDFYQDNFKAYFDRTVSVDPASFLNPLVEYLSPGAAVLDVGCGSGRDLRWLKERGFSVTGFERSKGLAQLARRHAGCNVIEGDFEDYDFSVLQVDGLLLCGALVHVPPERFESVLRNIAGALKPAGRLLISMKQGEKAAVDGEGRRFYYWRAEDLEVVFARQGLRVLDFRQGVSKVNAKDAWLSYVLSRPADAG